MSAVLLLTLVQLQLHLSHLLREQLLSVLGHFDFLLVLGQRSLEQLAKLTLLVQASLYSCVLFLHLHLFRQHLFLFRQKPLLFQIMQHNCLLIGLVIYTIYDGLLR